MSRFARILAPTDFSSVSFRAADYAVAIANRYGSTLHLLHVIPAEVDASHKAAADEAARARIDAFMALVRAQGVRTEVSVEHGEPEDAILKAAHEIGAELICLGTHGRRGVERLALGSVSEAVLRHASCPVLTVSNQGEEQVVERADFSNILCAVDFADCSLRALDDALSMCRENGGTLSIVSVVEWLSEEPDGEDPDLADYRARMRDSVQQRLDEALPEEARRDPAVETFVRVGKPYREILALAKERQSELIVMGVRGRNPLDLLLFGSTTHQTVRRAPCPVLTVREVDA